MSAIRSIVTGFRTQEGHCAGRSLPRTRHPSVRSRGMPAPPLAAPPFSNGSNPQRQPPMKTRHITLVCLALLHGINQAATDSHGTSRPYSINASGILSPATGHLRSTRTNWAGPSSSRLSPATTSRLNAANGTLLPPPGAAALARSAGNGRVVAQTIVERGPNHRICQTTVAQTNGLGEAIYRTNRYTELATGMHVKQPDGSWREASAEIIPTAEGAAAVNAQHQVFFAANVKSEPTIRLVTPDGRELRSRVVGLSYYDPPSDRAVLIAETKDSRGWIVSSNQVLYTNAFDGVNADVEYINKKSGFEQNIVLRERVAPPTVYGLGDNARLQVLTEFYDPPAPRKRVADRSMSTTGTPPSPEPLLVDETLDWGGARMGRGKAFELGNSRDRASAVPVFKRWISVDKEQRAYLVEEVPFTRIERQVRSLPEATRPTGAKTKSGAGSQAFMVMLEALAAKAGNSSTPEPMQLAARSGELRIGFVLDYQLISGTATDYRLKGDTTYYISDGFWAHYLGIEGGTVVKIQEAAILSCHGVVCLTEPYRPAFITSKHDDTVGEFIPGSNGLTDYYYPDVGLLVDFSPFIHDIRFRHVWQAISCGWETQPGWISNCQFTDCGIAITAEARGPASPLTVTVENCLFNECQYIFMGHHTAFSGEHLTINQVGTIAYDWWQTASLTATLRNSVLANVQQLVSGSDPNPLTGNHNGFFACPATFGTPAFTAATSPFETSGSGTHYLKSDSNFRAAGTTSIAYELLNSLKTKTTQPPIVFPRFMNLTGELTFFPQAPRYVSGAPDLGYHYDTLDFTAAAMFLMGGRLTIHPGTVVGFRQEQTPDEHIYGLWPWWWTGFGVELWEGASLVCNGTPGQPVRFTDVQLVQERDAWAAWALFVPWFVPDAINSPPPEVNCRFTHFHSAQGQFHFWSGWTEDWHKISDNSTVNLRLQDCNLYGGILNLGKSVDYMYPEQSCAVTWMNTLFDQVSINVDPQWLDLEGPWSPVDIHLAFRAHNNLFRGGRLRLTSIPTSGGNWLLTDNLFDKVAFEQPLSYESDLLPLDHDYNGYWRRTAQELEPGQADRLTANDDDGGVDAAHDKLLTAAPPYATGPLGSFYLPTWSLLLWNTGSRPPGAAGLYHYTTRVDQTKEGDEIGRVNIGLHYVATINSTSIQPKDTDTDGIPDYVEDANGNGQWEEGIETRIDVAYTDTGIHDSLNVIYDDLDLDGDGMVGRIEKALTKNPLVSDNPLQIAQFAAGTEPDTAVLSVPLSFATLTSVGYLELLVDGHAAPLMRNDSDGNGHCSLTWSTTFEQSGFHFFQVGLTLNGQSHRGGVGHLAFQNVIVQYPPYSYPLLPSDTQWDFTDPEACVAAAEIPEAWQTTATSWQLFSATIANPYFRGIWVPGTSISEAYSSAKRGILSVLNTVEASPDFGVNCLRYMANVHLPTVALADGSDFSTPTCMLDYIVVCHMASLDASLDSLDSTSLRKLFELAVWDADYWNTRVGTIVATAPVQLMYAIYDRPGFPATLPAGATLPTLSSGQSSQLDTGWLPQELGPPVSALKSALGLVHRP